MEISAFEYNGRFFCPTSACAFQQRSNRSGEPGTCYILIGTEYFASQLIAQAHKTKNLKINVGRFISFDDSQSFIRNVCLYVTNANHEDIQLVIYDKMLVKSLDRNRDFVGNACPQMYHHKTQSMLQLLFEEKQICVYSNTKDSK